jgi:hypothetical protein
MPARPFAYLRGLALAPLLTLLIGCAGSIVGTWDHTVQFPAASCTAPCVCPGGTPNVPIQELRQYQRHGALLAIGSVAVRGLGVGSWTRVGPDQFEFRFKFFRFAFRIPTLADPASLVRVGSGEVTGKIDLTGPNTYTSTATFDLFDVNAVPIVTGCPVNATATRFAD